MLRSWKLTEAVLKTCTVENNHGRVYKTSESEGSNAGMPRGYRYSKAVSLSQDNFQESGVKNTLQNGTGKCVLFGYRQLRIVDLAGT